MIPNIEREVKFLITNLDRVPIDFSDPYRETIEQGYIFNTPDKTLRVRAVGGYHGDLALKIGNDLNYRLEYEEEISVEYAKLLLEEICSSTGFIIRKDRHVVNETHNGKKYCWTVDVYLDRFHSLIVAEHEYSEQQDITSIPLPDWVDINQNITSDPRYLNCNLAKNHFVSLGSHNLSTMVFHPKV
jgi:CYTH domain-containing protein